MNQLTLYNNRLALGEPRALRRYSSPFIDDHRDSYLFADRSPFREYNPPYRWDIETATAYLVGHLIKNGDQAAAALDLFRRRLPEFEDKILLPEQMFPDLNKYVFADKISRSTDVEWRPLAPDLSGKTYPRRHAQCPVIVLNTENHVNTAYRDDVIGTMIHQMIHAYFISVCPIPSEGPDVRRNHGKHFGKIVYEIKKLARRRLEGHFPLEFGHHLLANEWDDWEMTGPYGRSFEDEDDDEWTIPDDTVCHSRVRRIDPEEIDDWFESKCEGKLLPQNVHVLGAGNLVSTKRSDLGSQSSYVELLWDGKSIFVARITLSRYPDSGFSRKFRSSSSSDNSLSLSRHSNRQDVYTQSKDRTLSLPGPRTGCTEDIVIALLTFLTSDTFNPDSTTLRDDDLRGPPLVREYCREWPRYLLTNLRLYKLAKKIDFDELATVALDRLKHMPYTHNDAMEAMTEVYNNGSSATSDRPDEKLRDWAKSFMKAYATPSPLASALSASNVGKMRKDPDLYGAYKLLYQKGGPFQQDVDDAIRHLESQPPGAPDKPTLQDLAMDILRSKNGHNLLTNHPWPGPLNQFVSRDSIFRSFLDTSTSSSISPLRALLGTPSHAPSLFSKPEYRDGRFWSMDVVNGLKAVFSEHEKRWRLYESPHQNLFIAGGRSGGGGNGGGQTTVVLPQIMAAPMQQQQQMPQTVNVRLQSPQTQGGLFYRTVRAPPVVPLAARLVPPVRGISPEPRYLDEEYCYHR
ncbi:hypothetical protein K402DRAFT_460623 [Aulographum hederae CBS 113979]|uniref:SprT-like domain-containing protein n=1 Tax=Aulographum hederae CBS 113979 TaxID=1176131 RepID=A0A6G1HA93_9PEZI|nr:hypothetical protein K402DRAFT_460623 [Aulographum hederae CBS 113979]